MLVEDPDGGETLYFDRCHQILEAYSYDAVPATLAAMLEAQKAGYFLAGYAAHELGYVLESRLEPA